MKILSEEALNIALHWLGDYLKIELHRESWKTEVDSDPDQGTLFLFPKAWRFPEVNDYVAFSFNWSNDLGDPPYVQLYLPTEERFPQRDQLLNRVRRELKQLDFTDHYEGDEDADPDGPLWRSIPLAFGGQTGVDLPAMLSAIRKGFQDLMKVEKIIDEAAHSVPKVPTCEHELKVIAVLDTEWSGMEPSRKMTELAIVNVAYDSAQDEVAGILGEYEMKLGGNLETAIAHALLQSAERIVAHNCAGDQSLLEKELPGVERTKWMCSLRGIDWKRRLGVRNADQNTLTRKFGLRSEQGHHAHSDAHELVRILAQRDEAGRTFLARLLDGESEIVCS